MKAYVMTTGLIFGLITVMHLLRFYMEGAHLVKEPIYILLTLLAAGMSLWAALLLKHAVRSQ